MGAIENTGEPRNLTEQNRFILSYCGQPVRTSYRLKERMPSYITLENGIT